MNDRPLKALSNAALRELWGARRAWLREVKNGTADGSLKREAVWAWLEVQHEVQARTKRE